VRESLSSVSQLSLGLASLASAVYNGPHMQGACLLQVHGLNDPHVDSSFNPASDLSTHGGS
jgi:hypothetical protein